MKRNILLIEPNYKNKYPPIGLMKLATYHRMIGDNVRFFKGDLKEFVLDNISQEIILKLGSIENSVDWHLLKYQILEYLKRGRLKDLHLLTSDFKLLMLLF